MPFAPNLSHSRHGTVYRRLSARENGASSGRNLVGVQMTRSHFDYIVRLLNREGSRRWAFHVLAVGALSGGTLTRGALGPEFQVDEQFQQCLRACLATCSTASYCPTLDLCAASCSQAML